MLIYDLNAHIIGKFDFNDRTWSGNAAKKVWNKYLMISRESKRKAEEFVETMKNGGHHSGFVSVPESLKQIVE
jgi:hypothetical protein